MTTHNYTISFQLKRPKLLSSFRLKQSGGRNLFLFTIASFLLLSSCTQQPPTEAELIEKAKAIHEKILTIDSHADTPMWMTREGFDIGKDNSESSKGSKVDLTRMEEGGLDACFFAVFVGQSSRDKEGNMKARNRAIAMFDTIHNAISRYPELAEVALTSTDAYRLEKQEKIAIFIGMENGYPIGNDLSLVEDYYKRGARYITLCHTKNNDICDSSTDKKGPEHDGLSEFGEEVVREMNRLGIMVDVSHVSDKSFYDILEASATPVIASHSCARAICDNPRNLDDDMLRALVRNGGVIQMCILSSYVEEPEPTPLRDSAMAVLREKYNNWENLSDEELKNARKEWQNLNVQFPRNLSSVTKVVDHIDHMLDVAGIDHIGIGTDFDGGGAVNGCYDVSEMENITIELVKRGYSEEDIEKIWGKNLMRVMREVEEYSKSHI
ncbi:MAG: dipeptidase [Bacteroidales bacterium]|nr:dipeptidase [Bacteroidales bacterium]